MVQLPPLDGHLLHAEPPRVEEPVVQINDRLSDQIVAEEVIVVHDFDDHGRRAGESDNEFVVFVELRVRFVQMVLVSAIRHSVATRDSQVGVTFGHDITLSQLAALEHIDMHMAVRLD